MSEFASIRPMTRDDIPATITRIVLMRCNGICEVPGCSRLADHLRERLAR